MQSLIHAGIKDRPLFVNEALETRVGRLAFAVCIYQNIIAETFPQIHAIHGSNLEIYSKRPGFDYGYCGICYTV